MKMIFATAIIVTLSGLDAVRPSGASAAPLKPHHLSARPIDNVSISKSDRAFLSDVAADILLQRMAAELAIEFAESSHFIDTAQFTLTTLEEIQEDLDDFAKVKDVALPQAGSVAKTRDFDRLMNSRNSALEREYHKYAARSSQRMVDRFREASKNGGDPEVRAFALRHVRWVETARHETKGLSVRSSMVAAQSRPTKVGSGRAAEIFEPPTSVPLAAAGSPASPGASR